MVLEYSDGHGTRFVCLDSKYTTSRSGILESMASAHIYRDSIKRQGVSPLCSLLLVPNNEQAVLLSSKGYVDRHEVGCILIADDNDAAKTMTTLLGYFTTLTDQPNSDNGV